MGSMKELVPCASPKTGEKRLLGRELHWLIVIFFLYSSDSMSVANTALKFHPQLFLQQLLSVPWLFCSVFYLPLCCPESPHCCHVGFVSFLSLLLLGQLNSEQNSKVLKGCLVQLKLTKYLKIFIDPSVKLRWQLGDDLTMVFLFHFSAVSKRSPLLSCKV